MIRSEMRAVMSPHEFEWLWLCPLRGGRRRFGARRAMISAMISAKQPKLRFKVQKRSATERFECFQDHTSTSHRTDVINGHVATGRFE